MSETAAKPKKGVGFKGKQTRVEVLPDELREIRRQAQEIKPEKIQSLFGPSPQIAAPVGKRSASSAALPVKAAKAVKAVAAPKLDAPPPPPPLPELVKEFGLEDVPTVEFEGDLKEMGDLIRAEERKNPYTDPEGPRAYIPETRRAFSEFIKENYERFMLKTGADKEETAPGDKYPYQKFVREYMRNDSPYRGILTYHGLGSGKTCTAIATAEALYATANKKIIVMTPFSLRKNFLKEVSLCGFRHFRLKNFWVSYPISDQTTRLFATSVLGISEPYLKTVQNIWIPDFRKTDTESNYASLTADQQTEIRKQILSILVWDEKKNPYGRIRFVNYNGISAKRLQAIACQKPACEFFDDAVIIVDEIHNLIRLMQGTIDPYLVKVAGLKRLIPLEEITPSHWNPKLCLEGTKTYMRGYLFYRLLLSAQNSKIIGLSGTPLINFPEELGILANVLHGYIPTIELTISESGLAAQKKCQETCLRFPYTDFVEVKHDPKGLGTGIMVTLLPQGIRKLADGSGVERIPEEETVPSVEETLVELKATLAKAELQVVGTPTAKALALLPPFGDDFRKKFIKADNSGLNDANKIVLVKRLTGLISYYKGSNEQLMPRVASDEVVRVPMSAFSQHVYMKEREAEVSKEAKKKKSTGELGGVWGEVYEVGGESQTSNYKMASRQACNFTFPSNVARPKPGKKDQKAEADKGNSKGDILDVTPDSMEPKGAEEFPEMEEAGAEDAAEALAASEEDAAIRGDLFQGEEGEGEGAALAATIDPRSLDAAAAVPVARGVGPAGRAAKAVRNARAAAAASILFSLNTDNAYKTLDPFSLTPMDLTYRDETHPYKSLEHFYQSIRFRDSDPDFEKEVRDTATPQDAKTLADSRPSSLSAEQKITNMKLGITKALDAVKGLRQTLLSSGQATLVYASRDPFWGNGGESGDGENHLGKIWGEVREEQKAFAEMPNLSGGAEEEEEDEFTEGGGDGHEADKMVADTTTVAAKKFVLKRPGLSNLMAKKSAEFKTKCETGQQAGEDYKTAVQRSKECLETLARDKMKLGAEGLDLYSPKFAAMLNKIGEVATDRGSSLVYSQFLDMEGIGIFKIAMDVNGYAPIEIIKTSVGYKFSTRTEESLKKGPGAQPRYITFSGGEEDDVRRICLDIFNANFNELPAEIKALLVDEMKYTDNKTGQLCRVFCITSAGAEGISLKNVRAVHIMEPYWNDVRLRQVKGRAIRIGSHLELDESERNVAIYTYLSVFSGAAQEATVGDARIDPTIRQFDRVERKDALAFKLPVGDRATEYIITTDERLYIIAERKKIILNALESVMKSAAVDCELNIQENKDGSFKCLPLRGKVGDFMYHPSLDEDIRESASKYRVEGSAAGVAAAPAPAAAAPAATMPTYTMQKFRGKNYRMKYLRPDPKAIATGFEMYAEDDVAMKTLLGKAGVNLPAEFGKEKPGKPVELF